MTKCKVCGKTIPDGVLCCMNCLRDPCRNCTDDVKCCKSFCESAARYRQALKIVNENRKKIHKAEDAYKETRWSVFKMLKTKRGRKKRR